jgi:DNA-binding transcriptional regulator YhcF (GntR family)
MSSTASEALSPSARVAADIRGRIAAGELRAGDRVPSTRDITRQWGVAMATATKALALLRGEGLVQAVSGRGTVVATPEARTSAAQNSPRRRVRDADRELTQVDVVRAAIHIANTEGLSVLSMRHVASALDIATMTVYRYVPSKYELVVMMADAVFGDWPPPAHRPPGWREAFEAIARHHWSVYQRHPWLAQVISFTRPEPTPNAVQNTEWALGALEGCALDSTTMLYLVVTLFGYVRGTAVSIESEAEAVRATGVSDEEWMHEQESRMTALMASGRVPILSRVIAQDIDFNLERFFEFGLQCLLDGMAVLVTVST